MNYRFLHAQLGACLSKNSAKSVPRAKKDTHRGNSHVAIQCHALHHEQCAAFGASQDYGFVNGSRRCSERYFTVRIGRLRQQSFVCTDSLKLVAKANFCNRAKPCDRLRLRQAHSFL